MDKCIASVVAALKKRDPLLGWDVAIDASDMPAYANGQRFKSKGGRERTPDEYSNPDASWGHRSAVSTRKGGGFYGYRMHMAVCSKTDLPLAWTMESGRVNETRRSRRCSTAQGTRDRTRDMRDGQEVRPHTRLRSVRGAGLPSSDYPLMQTPAVKRGEDKPPSCEHGEWRFAGADKKREATKWRCPTGECQPASVWIKADRLHTLIPRETLRWKGLYRRRASVERAFCKLKNEWSLVPLRVRRIERVWLHADLTILSQLSCALNKERALALAA